MTETDKLTIERLHSVLSYDAELGRFVFLVSRGACKTGTIAGSPSSNRYILINVDRRKYHAHRLAWFYVHGRWPKRLDHRNGDRADNRLSNLREASPSQNAINAKLRADNTSGLKGAFFHKPRRKWLSAIRVNGRQIHLGYFDTAEAAHSAYCAAAREHYSEFARPE